MVKDSSGASEISLLLAVSGDAWVRFMDGFDASARGRNCISGNIMAETGRLTLPGFTWSCDWRGWKSRATAPLAAFGQHISNIEP